MTIAYGLRKLVEPQVARDLCRFCLIETRPRQTMMALGEAIAHAFVDSPQSTRVYLGGRRGSL